MAEEIRQNILVTGEFEVTEAPGQQVSYLEIRGCDGFFVVVWFRLKVKQGLCFWGGDQDKC